MGVKYSAADSAQLIQAMTGNLQAANQVTDRLSSGCDHLIASLESGELQGAAYTAGKGLFTEVIIPAIKKLQEAIDDIQGELASYKSADSEVAGYGELDLDLLKEQLKIKNEQLAKVEKQIADNQDFFRNAGALLTGKLGDLLSQTSALMEVETQLNIGIREIQEKIDKLEWFVDQVSQYFTDSLQVLGLAIQGATQLSQVLVDSEGNYSTDGIDMSWSAKMKAQKIQTVSKSDYRTPQEQAIDKAVKDMKLSGAAEIYYRGKLAEKLQGKPRSEWKKIISNFNKDLKTDKGDNLLDVFNMTRAELEEKYGGKIQAYERFLTTGYGDASIATMSQDALQLIMARYDQVKNDHRGLSPTELAKVDPAFKKKIDGMSQEEIEKEFPELKNAISQAHVKPFGSLGMSETEWANHRYVTDRYFLMDSQKLLSWRDPNYTAKFNHYILEEGINPITLEPATAEEIQTAEWYNHIHPITETLSWGTALYSAYVGYNQYYNKPYTTIPEAFGKGKDWIKGKIPSMGSQPVMPEVGLTKGINVSPDNMVEGIPKEIGMPENANFAQKTYSNSFSEIGREKYSELAGKPINTIDDLVDSINTKKISISELPVEYIERDGHTLILNTRTSQALTQAGIPRSKWFTINRTGNSLYESLLDGQLKRNKLTSEGISEVRPSTRKGD